MMSSPTKGPSSRRRRRGCCCCCCVQKGKHNHQFLLIFSIRFGLSCNPLRMHHHRYHLNLLRTTTTTRRIISSFQQQQRLRLLQPEVSSSSLLRQLRQLQVRLATTTTTRTMSSSPTNEESNPKKLKIDSSSDGGDGVMGAAGITSDDQTNATERKAKGEFVRGISTARNWLSSHTDDDKNAMYPAASGRYHMYVAYNCPWCHRVLLVRAMLGLQDAITVDVLYPNRSSDTEPLGPNLWKFCPEGQIGLNGQYRKFNDCTVDTIHGKSYIKEIYELAGITNQKSVPILFDKQTNTIVSNESAEIVRMIIQTMTPFSNHKSPLDLFPSNKVKEIETLNDWIYQDLANGSYKAGFSSNQETYELAYKKYFAALDQLESRLEQQQQEKQQSSLSKQEEQEEEPYFLLGDSPTEADLRLYPVLFRHDPVYYNRMKLNSKYLYQYPYLWNWMVHMTSLPGIYNDTVSSIEYLNHCKQGYFGRTGNGTIPIGPEGYPECYKILNWKPFSK